MTADEHFLSRWSRLKKDALQGEDAPAPKGEALAPPAAPAKEPQATQAAAAATPAPELPPIESLKGLASEYTEFLKPGVDDGLRRAALKKLFADPYFETFEKFEAYCEDFTQGEPIPPAMLRTLEHAKGLLFDEKEEKKEEEEKEEKDTKVGASDAVARDEPRLDAPAQSEAKTEIPQPQSEQKT